MFDLLANEREKLTRPDYNGKKGKINSGTFPRVLELRWAMYLKRIRSRIPQKVFERSTGQIKKKKKKRQKPRQTLETKHWEGDHLQWLLRICVNKLNGEFVRVRKSLKITLGFLLYCLGLSFDVVYWFGNVLWNVVGFIQSCCFFFFFFSSFWVYCRVLMTRLFWFSHAKMNKAIWTRRNEYSGIYMSSLHCPSWKAVRSPTKKKILWRGKEQTYVGAILSL